MARCRCTSDMIPWCAKVKLKEKFEVQMKINEQALKARNIKMQTTMREIIKRKVRGDLDGIV